MKLLRIATQALGPVLTRQCSRLFEPLVWCPSDVATGAPGVGISRSQIKWDCFKPPRSRHSSQHYRSLLSVSEDNVGETKRRNRYFATVPKLSDVMRSDPIHFPGGIRQLVQFHVQETGVEGI